MASFTLRLGSLDLANFLRVTQGDGFDPFDKTWIEPGFAQSPFSDGQPLASTDIKNRETAWPLYLKGMAYRLEILMDTPASYWRLGETTGTRAADEKGAVTGTYTGGFTLGATGALAGDADKGVTLNGSTGWVAMTGRPLTVTDNWTLEAWVKPAALPQIGCVIEVGNDSGGYALEVGNGSGASGSKIQGLYGGVAFMDSGYTLPDTNYHHVVMVRESGTTKFYVDGNQTANSFAAAPGSPADVCRIGSRNDGTHPFNGTIDEVAVYSRALSAPQVLAHYHAGVLSTDKDRLHARVQQINSELAQPASTPGRVMWQDESASSPTFYDVAFGRLEPDYNFRLSEHGYGGFTLRLWVAGYGHTATDRLTATAGGTAAALTVPIPSVAGDSPAITTFTVTAGSQVTGWLGRTVGVAALPHPSYVFDWAAPSITLKTADATVFGATTAQGSQAVGLLAAAGAGNGLASYRSALEIALSPASVYAGRRHRLLGVVQGNSVRGVALNHSHAAGVGPTAIASLAAYPGFGVVDLGVLSVPSNPAGTYPIRLQAGGVAPNFGRKDADFVMATQQYGLLVNRLLLVPENSLRVVNDVPAAQIAGDAFAASGFVDGKTDSFGNIYQASSGLCSPTYGMTRPSQAVITDLFSPLLNTPVRDLVFQAVLRTHASVGVVPNSFTNSMNLNHATGGAALTAIMSLGSGVNRLFESFSGASVAIPSTAHAAILMEVGKTGTVAWMSARGLNSGLPFFASAAINSASLSSIEKPIIGVSFGHTGTAVAEMASAQMSADNFAVYSTPSEVHAARGVYRVGETAERADASANTLVEVNGRARGAAVRALPSTAAVGVFETTPGGPANDLLAVEVRVRERFGYAR